MRRPRKLLRFERNRLIAARAREASYRRALNHAGYLPQSIELAVEKDRYWLDTGTDNVGLQATELM